jgi:uncharacterized protein
VSGLGEWVAQNIVAHRNQHGPFRTRKDLKQVTGLGPKTFELSAGFLRIPNGDDPLDASGVHPKAYPVVRRILKAARSDIKVLIGNGTALKALRPEAFTDETFGLPTVTDILKELEKTGRDPRPAFKTAAFREGIENLADLKPGMVLEGVVTNVAAFGAFVNVGVHQDGLVLISALANTFVKDPRSVVKPGDVVRVKVLEVDQARKRIALTMRLDDEAGRRPAPDRPPRDVASPRSAPERTGTPARQGKGQDTGGVLADALRRAMKSTNNSKGSRDRG